MADENKIKRAVQVSKDQGRIGNLMIQNNKLKKRVEELEANEGKWIKLIAYVNYLIDDLENNDQYNEETAQLNKLYEIAEFIENDYEPKQ